MVEYVGRELFGDAPEADSSLDAFACVAAGLCLPGVRHERLTATGAGDDNDTVHRRRLAAFPAAESSLSCVAMGAEALATVLAIPGVDRAAREV